MQNCGRAERRRGLADAVLVDEALHDLQAAALVAEDRRVVDADVGQLDRGVVGRHVERPQELDDLEARRVGRHDERGDAGALAGLAAGAGEDHVVGRVVQARVPRLVAVDDPLVAVAVGVGLHPRGVGAVVELGDAEREAAAVLGHARQPVGLLLVAAVLLHQHHAEDVADDRVLGLQVAVQPEALRREVLADDGHAEVGAVHPAEPLRVRVAVDAGGVGPLARASRIRSSHSLFGRPPRSQSVRASSRRWSRKRMLSFSCSSGLISRSMKSSIFAEELDEVRRQFEVHRCSFRPAPSRGPPDPAARWPRSTDRATRQWPGGEAHREVVGAEDADGVGLPRDLAVEREVGHAGGRAAAAPPAARPRASAAPRQ